MGIEIFDTKGSTVLRSMEKTLDISELDDGIYFVAVTTSRTRIVRKLFNR
jgi:hypothetical protein